MLDADRLYAKLQQAISQDRLILPTLPEVALRIREEVEREDCSAEEVAGLLAQDSALSANLIRVANSPLYRASGKLTDINTIVSRLGIRLVRDLVVSLAMRQIFLATSESRDQYFRKAWARSVEIASISRVLATLVRGMKPERALLAGLIHNIGVLPVLVLAEQEEDFDDATLEVLMQSLQARVGGLILDAWDFPEYLREVVQECYRFERHTQQADYVDVVQVSLLQSGCLPGEALVEAYAKCSAFERLNLKPEINIIEIAENREAIDAAKQVLLH